MIESYLTQAMLTRGETAIGDYLRTGQTSYNLIKEESWTDLLQDLIARNLDVRRLCKRLYIEETALTKTAAYNGAISDEDFAQRMRLVIVASTLTGSAVFTLQGTNDEGTNYQDILLINDAGSSDTAQTITDTEATYSFVVTKLFSKYRLKLISIGTTITYTAYMIEEIFTQLHRDKTRANIYRSLMVTQSDEYDYKSQMYESMYQKRLTEGRMAIDIDDDDLIGEGEKDAGSMEIIFH